MRQRSPGAIPSSIGRPGSIQQPLRARVEPGLSKLGRSEARGMKHEWLHRVILGYRKWPTEQSRFTRQDLVVHKRRPLALQPADGRSISGERIPSVWQNEEKGDDRWGEGIRRGEGTVTGKVWRGARYKQRRLGQGKRTVPGSTHKKKRERARARVCQQRCRG